MRQGDSFWVEIKLFSAELVFLLVTFQPAGLLSAIVFQSRWPEGKDPCCQRAWSPGNRDVQDLFYVMYLFSKRWSRDESAGLLQGWNELTSLWRARGDAWWWERTSNTVCSCLLQNYHGKLRKITSEIRTDIVKILKSTCHRGLLQLNSLGTLAHVCTFVLPTPFQGEIGACDSLNLTLNLFKVKGENIQLWYVSHVNKRNLSQHIGETGGHFHPRLLKNDFDNWPKTLENVGIWVHIKTPVCPQIGLIWR